MQPRLRGSPGSGTNLDVLELLCEPRGASRSRRSVVPIRLLLICLCIGSASFSQPHADAAAAWRGRRAGGDNHTHSSGLLQGRRLLKCAQRHGALWRGLEALEWPHQSTTDEVLALATARMDLGSHFDHYSTYGDLNSFIEAAFPGARLIHWIDGAFRLARAAAPQTVTVQDVTETERIIRLAQQFGRSLSGIQLLISERRLQQRDLKATLRVLRAYPDLVAGINIHGPEDLASLDGDHVLHDSIDALLSQASRWPQLRPTLLLHVGERDFGRGGEQTVNRYLEQIAYRARHEPLQWLRFIFSHAVKVVDIPAATEALKELAALRVDQVFGNPLPISNVVFGAVRQSVAEINAIAMPWPLLSGTDNVGSLSLNGAIVDALRTGDLDHADALAAPYLEARSLERRPSQRRDTNGAVYDNTVSQSATQARSTATSNRSWQR